MSRTEPDAQTAAHAPEPIDRRLQDWFGSLSGVVAQLDGHGEAGTLQRRLIKIARSGARTVLVVAVLAVLAIVSAAALIRAAMVSRPQGAQAADSLLGSPRRPPPSRSGAAYLALPGSLTSLMTSNSTFHSWPSFFSTLRR